MAVEKISVHLRSYSPNPRNFLFPVASGNSDPDCHDERHPRESKLEPLEEVGRLRQAGQTTVQKPAARPLDGRNSPGPMRHVGAAVRAAADC